MKLRHVRWHAVLGCTALLISACGSAPPHVDAAAVQAYAQRGYADRSPSPGDIAGLREVQQDWGVGADLRPLRLLRPAGAGLLPLVIYLPGLGEDADAGEQWRQGWAAAGYAVLSLQPLRADAEAWRSELAREGEFRTLGQQRYGVMAMRQRLQALAAALAEVRRRGQAGDTAWQGIDWDRVALAGFDLGAYTAMAGAGERIGSPGPGSDGGSAALRPRAVIALSPFVNLADGALDARFAALGLPVLSITSDVDGDPLGLVANAPERAAPFEHMPGPDKYLLTLQGLPHERLAGGLVAPASAAELAARSDQDAARDAGGDPGSPGSRGGRRRGPDAGAADTVRGTSQGVRQSVDSRSLTAAQMRITAALGVSTAFLDAYLKHEAPAGTWLAQQAGPWLAQAGQLQRK